jgi:flagellar protein FlaI
MYGKEKEAPHILSSLRSPIEVIEPKLTDNEERLLNLIKDAFTQILGYELEKMKAKDKEEYLRKSVDSFIESRMMEIDDLAKSKVIYYLIRDFVGYGPIDVLMSDPKIEDISCDGPNIPLFIFHQSTGNLFHRGYYSRLVIHNKKI